MGGAQPTVLLVDGDRDEVELVAEYLERQGSGIDARVTTATDPMAALERFEGGERFDCVVSDSRLPGMDGIRFVETVREYQPGVPVVLFASGEASDVAGRVVEAGVTDFLEKGFGADQYTMLVRRVNHALADGDGAFDDEADVELDRVAVIGRDERFETVDEEYAALYGYTAEEVRGRHWADLHPESAAEHVRSHILPVVQAGGQWSGRSEGCRADGTRFTESKLVQALDDGRLLVAVSELPAGQETTEQGTAEPAEAGREPDAASGPDSGAGAGAEVDTEAEVD
ncbi:response regulator [Salinirubellus salinus]|jgi:PAS domain S-box-containing protein|uniref:Response regulator n=1 Tax=Salinirubellus salinus TaxID=1364945 RepID=A0A9E7UA49_9EURY|nr:response regulator [Salinirubellus salinus]UWM53853.1 response regulator [Salinirubellus salinus]